MLPVLPTTKHGRRASNMRSARVLLSLMLLSVLTSCYSDMQYGMEEPDEDEAEELWWCKYRNNCEKSEPSNWW